MKIGGEKKKARGKLIFPLFGMEAKSRQGKKMVTSKKSLLPWGRKYENQGNYHFYE